MQHNCENTNFSMAYRDIINGGKKKKKTKSSFKLRMMLLFKAYILLRFPQIRLKYGAEQRSFEGRYSRTILTVRA